MKNKFLSKSVPRGTRTIWRYLSALFILFTFAIGNVWAADYTIYEATSSGVNTSNVDKTEINVTFNSMKAVSNSPVTTVANAGYGVVAGLKAPKWGGAGSGKNIAITVKDGYIATITAYVQVNTASQTVTIKESTETGTTIHTVSCAEIETVYEVKKADLAAGTYYIKASDKVGLIKLLATVTSAGGDPEQEDTTAPTLASSVPANAATNVAVSGNIVLTFNETIASVDASKFTLTGATKGTVAIDGTDAKKVNVGYTAENDASVTLAVAAEAVADAAGNKSAELSNISFTTVAAAPAPDVVLNNNGTLNSTDFVTLVSELDGDDYSVSSVAYTNNFKFGNTCSSIVNQSWSNKYLAYDVKTTSATLKLYVYNKNSNSKNLYYQVLSETGNGDFKTESITSKGNGKIIEIPVTATKGTRVVFGANSTDVRICQLEVYENGTTLTKAGEVGYELALKGRPFATGSSYLFSGNIDGMEYVLYSELKLVNNNAYSVMRNNDGTHYFKIPATNDVQLKVTTDNSAKFYVLGSAVAGDPDKDVQYGGEAGTFNVNLPHKDGYWYIIPVVAATGTGNEVRISKIAFATLPAGKHVTYSAGDGSVKEGKSLPTHADAWEGDKITLASGENLENSGYDFSGWKANGTGDLLKVGDKYTMTNDDVQFVAQWTEHIAKYGVKFMDGATKLDSLSVTLGEAPVFANPTKALYSFAGWKDGEDNDVTLSDLATSVTVEDTKLVLYAQWDKAYAADGTVNFADDNNSGALADFLPTGYACGNLGTGSTWGKESEGDVYFGYKLKNSGAYVELRVVANKRVTFTFGNYAAAGTIKVGDAEAATCTLTDSKYVVDTDAEAVIRFTTTSGGTVTLKSIIIGEIPAKSDDATLKDLKVGGETIDGFNAGTLDYYVELPYASTSQPVVTATPNDENASGSVMQTIASLEDAVVTVIAEDLTTTKVYRVHFTVAPKLGVELIKATHTGATTASKAGYWKADATVDKNTYDNSKLGGKDNYFGLTLGGTKKFMNGDLVVIYLDPAQAPSAWLQLFKDKGSNMIADVKSGVKKGANYITLADLPAEGIDQLYLYRTEAAAGNMNPYANYIAVYRQMAPFIESFEIEGVDNFEIDQTNKTITASVANSFDVTALTPTVKFWANGGGSIDKTGAQNFTNPVQYTVSSAYAEDAPVTYTVTITKVVPSVEPTITTQPAGANYYEDATINALSVVAESTAGTLSYQWQVKEGLEYEDIDGATNASYTPAISAIGSYIYRVVVTNTEESKPSTSVISDDATIVIAEDPAAIKLLNGETVNHTNFITGVSASKVTISSVEYDCVTFASGVGEHVNSSNIKNLDRHISYNATTTQTKVKLSLYNSNGNNRTIYVKGVVEGSTEEEALATIQLAGNEQKTTEWIEFNNAKNRTIYIFVSGNAGDIKILQEKVIESGEPLKKAGQAGYSLNMNKGRMFGASSATIAFEGMTYTLNGDYTTLSSGVLKVKSNNIVFNVTVPTLLKVTTANDKTYYVGTAADATTNETAKSGVSEFDLTAGTWYINAGGSEVQFTNIAFEAPKCEKPTVVDMENIGLCEGDAFIALNVSASVTDGTLHYQWYKHPAEGDDEEVGTDAASYTPTADGQYYVVVTNKLAGYTDNAKTSNTVTVAHFASAAITTAPENQRKEAGQVATLTVVATGKAPLTYQWYTCDDEAGNNPVIIDGADEDTYEVTVTAAMSQYYKVVVGSGCGSAEAVALVEEWHEVAPANVTGSITWNWAGSAWDGISGDIAFDNTGVEQLMANVSSKVPVSDAGNFRADMLYGTGQYVWRSGNKFFQGTKIRFITEVPGFLTVHYRNTSGSTNTRKIEVVNNSETLPEDGTSTTNNWKWTNKVFVQAGEVILNGIASEADGLTRIDQIVFNANPDYPRNVSSNYGTLCVEHNVPAGQYFGATFYQIASRNEDYDYKIDFEEVLPNEELKAGEPYLFKSNTGKIELFYGEETAANPIPVRGMIGNYAATLLPITEANKNTIYYFAQNKLWLCDNLVGGSLTLNDHRAYIDLTQVPTYAEYEASKQQQQNSAPRRRVSLEMNGEQVATGCENLNAADKPVKMIINGQLFIIRGEKMYDAKGQLVK